MARNSGKENQVNQTGLYWPEKRIEVERVILQFQIFRVGQTVELTEEQYFFLKEKPLELQKQNQNASIVSIIRDLIEKDREVWNQHIASMRKHYDN